MTQDNPFAPETRENPTGFRTREFTVRAEPAGDAPDAPLAIAISSEAPVARWDWRTGEEYDEVLDHGPSGVDLSYVADGLPFLRRRRATGEHPPDRAVVGLADRACLGHCPLA